MRALLRCALFATLLVTGSVNVWAADGRIFAFEGDVQVNGQAVTDATELNANDTIVTGPGASVKILLADNSVLDLDSDTSIKISDYNYDPAQPQENTSEVEIVQGTLRYVSGLIAKENHENIGFTAGNSTIGVRGSYTEIEMSGMVVNVEALIGEAIVVIEDDDCPDKTYVVRTGEVAYTDPETCETVLGPASKENIISALAYAIAADPDDPGLKDRLAKLSAAELALLSVVINNNAEHLGLDPNNIPPITPPPPFGPDPGPDNPGPDDPGPDDPDPDDGDDVPPGGSPASPE